MRLIGRQKRVEISFEEWGFHILDRWLTIKNRKKSLATYFEDNEINSIAIYGLGILGRHFYEELRDGKIWIKYGIDQNAANIRIDGLELKTLNDELPAVDAIIITPVTYYKIEKEVRHKMGKEVEIISIEDVVDYCFGKQE